MSNLIVLMAEVMRVVMTVTRPISSRVMKFIYLVCMGRTKTLPAINNPVLLSSATKLAEKLRTQQLKCVDVVRAYIDRARLVQPFINAIVDERYDKALEEARGVDSFLESKIKPLNEIERDTPLLGVPFSCKESVGVKGLSQTAGIYKVKGRKAEKDSDAAKFYREAGAIPVTVTNVPELCAWWDSSNLIYGKTRNPYDHSRTPGGSSGGEAALLTSGGAVIGIGSDGGGSIRTPASFCGVYGHKPTMGVVSNEGKYPNDTEDSKKIKPFQSVGPMCRYVEDLPLLFKIISGNDTRLQLHTKVNFCAVKLYYLEECLDLPVVSSVKQATKEAANFFEERYKVKAIPLRLELKNALLMFECKRLEMGVPLPQFKVSTTDKSAKTKLWFELLKVFLRLSQHTFSLLFLTMTTRQKKKDKQYHTILKQYEKLEKKFQEIFEEDAIFLIPTFPEPAPFYHLTVPYYVNIGFTSIFNTLGYPSTSIPAGMSDGLPIGIQAVSGPFKDHLTIAAALELDKKFGGWKSPCPLIVS